MNKDDFPQLDTVYLDSAYMSLQPEQVIDAINTYYHEYPGCPGRSAHTIGDKATDAYDGARETVASFIGAPSDSLVWTAGTTEAINTVAQSCSFDRVILSDREHNSNLVPWQDQDSSIHTIPTSNGFDTEQFKETVQDGDLVSMVHVSNLDGYE